MNLILLHLVGAGYAAIKEAKKYPESGIDENSKILIILTEKPA